MNRSKAFLTLCEELARAGHKASLDPGNLVVRGFADLGYEVFQVLPGEKLLSLYTGAKSELQADQRDHFFQLLTCDELTNLILERGFDIERLEFKAQREWQITIKSIRDQTLLVHQARMLDEVFVKALISTYSLNQ